MPRAAGELERRFLEPYVRRGFAGVPELDYMRDLRAGGLPPNVVLREFYFRPGAMLGLPAAQQRHTSSNYTHVARDMHARGVNAVLVMVAERAGRYSLQRCYALLREREAALVIGDNPKRAFQAQELTADWTFVRLHYGRGRKGNYSEAQLKTWARQIKRWARRVDVYAYFNNDWGGPRNALRLLELLGELIRPGGAAAEAATDRSNAGQSPRTSV